MTDVLTIKGGGSGGHIKIAASSLFSKLWKSHIMSNGHIHSWLEGRV